MLKITVLALVFLVGYGVTNLAWASRIRVIDGDTLEVEARRHRLFGIDAAEHDQPCKDPSGEDWACAQQATEALEQLLKLGPVLCEEVPGTRDGFGRQISRCKVNGNDVAEALVRDGLAWAFRRYSSDYVDAEAQARAARRGVWAVAKGSSPNQPPWAWRAARRTQTAARPDSQPTNADCRIKGNDSGNGRIYHLPGSPDYAATRINVGRGERWFCSEQQARAAGWRPVRGQ